MSANEYSCAHGAQINFGDITLYLTYAADTNGLCTEAGLEEQSGLIPQDPAVRPPGPPQLLVSHFGQYFGSRNRFHVLDVLF